MAKLGYVDARPSPDREDVVRPQHQQSGKPLQLGLLLRALLEDLRPGADPDRAVALSDDLDVCADDRVVADRHVAGIYAESKSTAESAICGVLAR